MIELLFFYWFFSGMFVFGALFKNNDSTIDKTEDLIIGLLMGWLIFPAFIGNLFYKIDRKLWSDDK